MTEQDAFCDNTELGYPYDLQPFAYLIVTDQAFKIQAVSNNCSDWGASNQSLLDKPLQELLQGRVKYWTRQLKYTIEAEGYQVFACQLAHDNKTAYYIRGVQLANDLLAFEIEPQHSDTKPIKKTSLSIISELSNRVQYTQKLKTLLSKAIVYLRQTFHFDKAMIYQFDEDFTGTVVAESGVQAMPSYLGLKFPSTDVPKPAREMLCQVPFRYTPDVHYDGRDMTIKTGVKKQLHLTPCCVSPVAPVHKNYLHNMGVSASLTIPLMIGNELWGLIAFHHREVKHLSPANRQLLRVLANHLQLAIQNQNIMHERANTDKAVTLQQNLKEMAAREHMDIWQALKQIKQPLCRVLTCQGFALVANDTMQTYGQTPDPEDIRQFLQWLDQHHSEHFATTHLPKLDERFHDWRQKGCGVYCIRLLLKGEYYLIFFRPEAQQEVQWAGNPDQPYQVDETGQYHPRASFESWREQQSMESKRWDDFDNKTIAMIQYAVLEHLTQQLLYDFANTDPLTKAYNRRYLFRQLPGMMEKRNHKNDLSVIIFDIDHFKRLNDTFGHQAGDYVLKELVTFIQNKLRRTDFIARYGGEEFLAVLSSCDYDNATQIADNLRSEFAQKTWIYEGQDLGQITLSAGVAASSHASNYIQYLIANADKALYKAKQAGRNRVVAYDKH